MNAAPSGYTIRVRRAVEDAQLVEVENRAAELFRAHGYPGIADAPLTGVGDFRAMIDDCRVWVAADASGLPAGYAVAGRLGGHLHLRELSVDPAHGRRGIGTALVKAVIVAARDMGAAGVSLTTFRSVPFNQPFYESLDFHEVSLNDAPAELVRAFHQELPPGIDETERVMMVRQTVDSASSL